MTLYLKNYINQLLLSILIVSLSACNFSFNKTSKKNLLLEPIVTAKKIIDNKKKNGRLKDFIPPKIVIICYQSSTVKYLLEKNPDLKPSDFSGLYFERSGQVGVLGVGKGAPELAIRMEELIALGVTKFIAVGTAGTLVNHNFGEFIISSKALAEDGVAHHYLPKNENFSKADDTMLKFWKSYAKKQLLPAFTLANPWSFSAIFKENPLDITRVKKQGYSIVEMEAATLYAIGQEKGVKTLSLFVISDKVSLNEWATPNKEAIVKINLHKLADWALEFCKKDGLLIN